MSLRHFSIYISIILLAVSCASLDNTVDSEPSEGYQEKVAELVRRLPASDHEENRWFNDELVALGPEAVETLTRMVATGGDDAGARYALNGLAKYVSRPGAEQEREMFENALLNELEANRQTGVKIFLMEQLELTGTNRSVPVLKRLLSHPALNESAVHALRAVNTPEARQALLGALGEIQGESRMSVIKALGDMEAVSAAPELLSQASSGDLSSQKAALYALAQTGNPAAQQALATSLDTSRSYLKKEAEANYLIFIDRLKEEGHARRAADLSRDLLAGDYPVGVKCAALSLLAEIEDQRAMDQLLEAVASPHGKLRARALSLFESDPERSIPDSWLTKLPERDPKIQVAVLRMLTRNPGEATPVIQPFLDSESPRVRTAAYLALVSAEGEQALPTLLERLTQARTQEDAEALKNALLRLPTDPLIAAAAETLPRLSGRGRVALIEVLAARRAASQLDTVLDQLDRDPDPRTRLAVFRALKHLAGPEDLPRLTDLLTGARSQEERRALQNALVAVAQDVPEPGNRSAVIVGALEKTSDFQKSYLLEILPEIGGAPALDAVVSASGSSIPAVRDAALTALADWRESRAIAPLLKVFNQAPARRRTELLKGYIRLVQQSKHATRNKIRYLNEAARATTSTEEKRIVVAGFQKIDSPGSLHALSRFFTAPDKAVREQSFRTAAKLLLPYYNGFAFNEADRAFAMLDKGAKKEIKRHIRALKAERKEEEPGGYTPDYSSDSAEAGGMNRPPKGYKALFNGRNLDGWKGLVGDPESRARMSDMELNRRQKEADAGMQRHWSVREGVLYFDGKGHSLVTEKKYKDFEMLVDWKIEPGGDSGIYLRGSPQVQIWDITEWPQGSGGLYNNKKHSSKPLVPADNSVGEWNSMRIRMVGEKVTVHLNDQLVVPGVVLENYWNRDKPIYDQGQIELQSHNTPLYFKNIYIREIPRKENLFNGQNLKGWVPVGGDAGAWQVSKQVLFTEGKQGGGWLSTRETFDDFKLELEYRLPEGGNSGIFLRAPRRGNPAYRGIEIQLLDDYAAKYGELKPWQYTGSLYDVQAPSTQAAKKAGEWQSMQIVADGPKIQVHLNGRMIVNTSLVQHMNRVEEHPGLKRRSGYIGLQNHQSRVEFRNIKITEIK